MIDPELEGTVSAAVEGPSASTPPDPHWDDWDTPLQAPQTPLLHLDGFDGPMELLLDLAERQRIDLGRLSILELTSQFVDELDGRLRGIKLERRAEWLVLASRLLLLRTRLMTPAGPAEAAAAWQEAASALAQVEAGAVARAAASWLEAQPQLGRDVFTRPRAGRDPRVASYMALMEACLVLLRGRDGQPTDAPVYQPPRTALWRVSDVLARMRAKLVGQGEAAGLEAFLPPVVVGAAQELRARGAVAGTFLAALELCRGGEVTLEQSSTYSAVVVRPLDQTVSATTK